MKKVYVCLLFTLLSAIMAGCAKDAESISAEDSSVLMSEEGGVLDDNRTVTLNLEDFWKIETNEDNTVKFVTGLELTVPDEWRENIVYETESDNSSFNRLLVCEKGNADAGLGGILFCLEYVEYTENPIVIMDRDIVFGLYEQGGKEYALLLTWPGDRQYSEDNQALINAYIELNSMAEKVNVDTNKMAHFTEKDISELERIIYESDTSEVFEEEKRMLSSINDDLLGCGWLLYTVPDQEDQDYKLYFFADESKDGAERLTPFEEMDFNLDQVDFVFPDARENNRSIGKFIGIYLFEPFTTKSGESAWIVVATYETDGRQYYDTRIYTPSEEGYVIDESMTEELNALYSDVEEYPVLQIMEMPHD